MKKTAGHTTHRKFAPGAEAPSPAQGTAAEPPRARVIALARGNAGVGQSSLCANLGIALAQQGRRVCLFDAATDTTDASRLPGFIPRFTLQDLLQQNLAVDDLLTTGPGGVQLLPAAASAGIGEFIHLSAAQQHRLLAALKICEQRFDYLLIDTATGRDQTLLQFLLAAPYTILTVTPEPAALTDTFSLLKVLKRYYCSHPLLVIVNRVSCLAEAHDTFRRLKQTAARALQLEIRYLGYALSDQALQQSWGMKQPILLQQPEALFSQCLTAIANRLRQLLDQPPPAAAQSFSGFFEELSLPREQLTSHDRAPVAMPPEMGVDETPVDTDLSASTDKPMTPISSPRDQRAALLAATYYAHLLGFKEVMNG